MLYLKQVHYKLPNIDKEFIVDFLNFLSPVGKVSRDEITLKQSNNAFFPITSVLFTNTSMPQVSFIFSNNASFSLDISNDTNVSKRSPHQYSHISLKKFIHRISPFKLKDIDHTGFNLPYFDGIHPKILELREKLKSVSLYHTFPEHLENAPWDFILPATMDEINKKTQTDYFLNRKPKIEIVSFDKSSTPLIQFDVQLEGDYQDWVEIFPEAIQEPERKSLFVYIRNDFDIDVCFVLNEVDKKDWSYHFSNSRLV